MVLSIIFTLLQFLFAVCIFYMTIAFVTGAPFVPSNTRASFVMLKFAQIKKGDRVYDLGSGDGRLLYMSAEKGATAIGFEINPILVFITYIRKIFLRDRSHIHIYWKNFWKADFYDADIVFVYLLPWKMEKLEQKLMREMRPGTRVISNSFIFPHLKLTNQDTTNHIYEFRIPKNNIVHI